MNYNVSEDYSQLAKKQGFVLPVMYPHHQMMKNMVFSPKEDNDESYLKAKNEAHLADAIARVAEDNGMEINAVQRALPFILRMLKSKSVWAE